jgi:(S)-ureidoglycine aminohydrolase
MLHSLGSTRSSLKADHLLQTSDTFIRTPLPGATGVEFIVHAGPRLGAGFTQMTAEFAAGGMLAPLAEGVERFLYVLEGQIDLGVSGHTRTGLTTGKFAYLPPDTPHFVEAKNTSRAVVIERRYEPVTGTETPEVWVGDEAALKSEPLGGDAGLQVKRLMPDGPSYDFAVNTMTYDPGAALAMVEVHVMEHGLLMLEGGGIYRLGDSWYPVTAGDFIWMAPYCPQWFGALGKTPAKYLIYKDWFRHPLGA